MRKREMEALDAERFGISAVNSAWFVVFSRARVIIGSIPDESGVRVEGVQGLPVPCNVDASRNPDPIVCLHVVEEALQRTHAPRAAEQSAVHADAHHRRPFGPLGVASVTEAQRPGHDVDQKAACLSCHDLEELKAKVKHAPAEAGECSACHNPHVARFKKLLRDRPGPLCARCHETVQAQLARKAVHRPVAEGKCASCHRPHGSPNGGLLVASSRDLCATCHAEVTAWKDRKVQHSPFAQGRCAACHEPHASDNAGLLTRDGFGLCGSCHKVDAVGGNHQTPARHFVADELGRHVLAQRDAPHL